VYAPWRIRYPAPFAPSEARGSGTFLNTALALHKGDWHQAFAIYLEWFKRAIPAVDSSARDWFKNVWQSIDDPH